MLRMLLATLHSSVGELSDRLTRPEPVPSFISSAAGARRRPPQERSFLRKGQGRVAAPSPPQPAGSVRPPIKLNHYWGRFHPQKTVVE